MSPYWRFYWYSESPHSWIKRYVSQNLYYFSCCADAPSDSYSLAEWPHCYQIVLHLWHTKGKVEDQFYSFIMFQNRLLCLSIHSLSSSSEVFWVVRDCLQGVGKSGLWRIRFSVSTAKQWCLETVSIFEEPKNRYSCSFPQLCQIIRFGVLQDRRRVAPYYVLLQTQMEDVKVSALLLLSSYHPTSYSQLLSNFQVGLHKQPQLLRPLDWFYARSW